MDTWGGAFKDKTASHLGLFLQLHSVLLAGLQGLCLAWLDH